MENLSIYSLDSADVRRYKCHWSCPHWAKRSAHVPHFTLFADMADACLICSDWWVEFCNHSAIVNSERGTKFCGRRQEACAKKLGKLLQYWNHHHQMPFSNWHIYVKECTLLENLWKIESLQLDTFFQVIHTKTKSPKQLTAKENKQFNS